MAGSSPTIKCFAPVFSSKCATPAGELRVEIGNGTYPARMIPITVVAYGIASAHVFEHPPRLHKHTHAHLKLTVSRQQAPFLRQHWVAIQAVL